MTSRPLFASVAESIVIFAPIVQVGWRRACSGVTAASVGGRVEERSARGGEDQRRDAGHRLADEALPDRRVLRVDRAEPGERARERVGRASRPRPRRRAPRASGITRWPPATSVSLLAVATTLPAARAASDGPEADDAAGRRRRRDRRRRGRELVEGIGAADASVPGGRSSAAVVREGDRRPAAAGAPARRARRLRPAASATTRSVRDARRARRPPGGPIEPGRAEQRDPPSRAAPAQRKAATTYRVDDRRREQERVDAVEDPAVARDQRAGVLGAGGPLEHRLGEVAGLGGEADQRAEDERAERRSGRGPQHRRRRRPSRRRSRRSGPA